MKRLALLFFLIPVLSQAQSSKDQQEVVERTYLLSHTVFGTKDSVTLNDLFANTLTYGHSHGNLQTREQALSGISRNKSTYTDTAVSNISVVFADDDVAIVRHLFKANEHKADGSISPLNFTMMLVWVKEKKKWRLFGRQAVCLN